ncbi:hypothetical protein ACBI99_35275 [Nonomuraea sp. ATR24]|uniref:hypothetical protein n=1 Tax=Nonomuraea TaxID=83681 RepID=UPI001C5D5D28|nr:hypothetical protein [Nonomuraea ceibae]
MRTSPRKLAAVVVVAGGLVLPASAAHAVVDPKKISVLDSVQRIDPVLMANCTTGGAADPLGAVVIPPEVPLVGCLTL